MKKEQLFNLELFNPQYVVFPQMVFKKKFRYYYFMEDNGWFNKKEDFEKLRIFMEAVNEPILYCSTPSYNNLPDIEIEMAKGHQHFLEEYLFTHKINHTYQHIGLRISAEAFWYGESGDWAMVSDVVSNLIIIGCDAHAALNFKADFGEEIIEIEQVVADMEQLFFIIEKSTNENAKFSPMDNREKIINLYKNH